MGRRLGGTRHGRVLPGLAAALVARYAELDKAFCRRPLAAQCHWCATLAELKAGRPVAVDAGALHPFLDHDEFACSGEWRHDDRGAYLVTGDRWERLSDGRTSAG